MTERAIIGFWIFLILMGPSIAGGDSATPFRAWVPLGGMRYSDTFVYFMSIETQMTKDGTSVKGQPRSNYRTIKKDETILAADATVTRARVSYTAVEEKDEDDASIRIKRNPVSGFSYTAAWDNGEISAVKLNGSPMTEAEVSFLRRDMRLLGRSNPYNLLASMKLAPGQAVNELRPALVNDLAEAIRDTTIDEFSIIYKGMEISQGRECGRFDLHVRLGKKDASGLQVAVEMKGRFLVNTRTSRPTFLYIEGPVTLSGDREGVRIVGTGRASVSLRSEEL